MHGFLKLTDANYIANMVNKTIIREITVVGASIEPASVLSSSVDDGDEAGAEADAGTGAGAGVADLTHLSPLATYPVLQDPQVAEPTAQTPFHALVQASFTAWEHGSALQH